MACMGKGSRYQRSSKLLDHPIDPRTLPIVVPRTLAAKFGCLSTKTLQRAERLGRLTPIKRNTRTVAYQRDELLRFLGAAPIES